MSTAAKQIELVGESLLLHPWGALYRVSTKQLLLADVHWGKAAHFRQAGLPVPQGVADANWDKLHSLIQDMAPDEVIILGDLFHSVHNAAWEDFRQLREDFAELPFYLVIGNHDILSAEQYADCRLTVWPESTPLGPFLLTHHPLEAIPEGYYNLAGHVHPCVYLQGVGHQRLRLPCFHFGTDQGILPAFGLFTGMAAIRPKGGDRIFVLADNEVIEV